MNKLKTDWQLAFNKGIEIGQKAERQKMINLINKRIKEHKSCDEVDTYSEQHMEHSVILAELEFIESSLEKTNKHDWEKARKQIKGKGK
jgi:hypothetical protein